MKNKLQLQIETDGTGPGTKVVDIETGKILPVKSLSFSIGPWVDGQGTIEIVLARTPIRMIGVYQLVKTYEEQSEI